MTRLIEGMTVTLGTTVKSSGSLTDAPEIVFKYKITDSNPQHTRWTEITPTRQSLGTYSVTFELKGHGTLWTRWDTDGALDVAQERPFRVYRSAGGSETTSDYN